VSIPFAAASTGVIGDEPKPCTGLVLTQIRLGYRGRTAGSPMFPASSIALIAT
jgi:hypothetical protein